MLSRGTAALIAARIEQAGACLQTEQDCTSYAVVDDLLPDDLALRIAGAFPSDGAGFRRLDSFRERKFTTNAFDRHPPILQDIAYALQAPEVIEATSRLTGIADMLPDPTCYAGGLSVMRAGDFLNPHIDNSHNGARTLYRRVNLLFYANPDWREGDGGELELWDRRVKRAAKIEPRFNRLAVMVTDRASWHSVAPIQRGARLCVSSYFFTAGSPTGADYYHVTSYNGRPDQPVRRVVSAIDNAARNLARRIGAKRASDKGYTGAHSGTA